MTDNERQRLAAILGMLGSAHAGERATAARKAEALRCKLGLTWAELLSTQPPEPEDLGMPEPPRPWTGPEPAWVPESARPFTYTWELDSYRSPG